MTSAFLARDFKLAPVYALLLSLETKTNTNLIQNLKVMTEKANQAYEPSYIVLQIVVFFLILVAFICGSFDHADVKYNKWMPASKSLLFIMMLQVFGSPIYKILFTLFEMDITKGFGLSSQVFLVFIEVLHFYLWMDSFFYEQVSLTQAACRNSSRCAYQKPGDLSGLCPFAPKGVSPAQGVSHSDELWARLVLHQHGFLLYCWTLLFCLPFPLAFRAQTEHRTIN